MKYRMPALYEYYLQSIKYGIEYLKGNPNILQSEVKLINEVLNK